jgi:hypothetical protein
LFRVVNPFLIRPLDYIDGSATAAGGRQPSGFRIGVGPPTSNARYRRMLFGTDTNSMLYAFSSAFRQI